jgi:hypothetical protein
MQLACTLTFEATHGVSCDSGINHPNQYFSESQKVLRAKVGAVTYYTLLTVFLVLCCYYLTELIFQFNMWI